jgi:hypothetical protein
MDRAFIILGIAFLLAGLAIRASSPAHADLSGPTVTGGVNPLVDVSGDAPGGTTTVYTVPAGQVLVVTGIHLNPTADLLEGATTRVYGGSRVYLGNDLGGVFAWNAGHLVFSGGSDVNIDGGSPFHIQGYLAHP